MTRRDPSEYDYDALDFDETLLTKHFSKLTGRDILFVVVHHMTVTGDDKDDNALDACYAIWQKREASAHYGVQGEQVRQYVWDKDFAWATGSNYGNLHGISIEHTNTTREPNWLVSALTWKTGAKLAAYLHKKYKLGRPVDGKTLRKHSSFTSTACPGPYLGGSTAWKAYVAEAQRVYDSIGKVVVPVEPPPVVVPPITPITHTIQPGDTLYALARKYRTTVEQLQAWNGLKTTVLTIGNLLKVAEFVDVEEPPTPLELWLTQNNITWNLAGYNSTQGTGKAVSEAKQDAMSVARVPAIGEKIEAWNRKFGIATVELQECSAAMLRVLPQHVPSFNVAPGDGLGRVILVSKQLVLKSGGAFQPKSKLNGDDKPGVWAHYLDRGHGFVVVSGHTENQDGVDSKTGRNADLIRVDQALAYWDKGIEVCDYYNLPHDRLHVSMDGNSDNMVREALAAKGAVSSGVEAFNRINDEYKTHTDWKPAVKASKPGAHFDLSVALEGPTSEWTKFEQVLDSETSDHNAVLSRRRVKV